MAEWTNRTEYQVQEDITQCRNIRKRARTDRQDFVASNYVQLEKMRRAKTENDKFLTVDAEDQSIMNINQFSPPPSQLECKTFNVHTGELVTFSLKKYLFDGQDMLHRDYALILHGSAGLGKSPLARTLCAMMAKINQAGGAQDAAFIQVSTADMLRGAAKHNHLKPGTPILFDELNPGEHRGTRPAHTIEDMKVLLDVPLGGTLNARQGDIHFEANMPRVFTCNASDPHTFFPTLPVGVWEMSAHTRAHLSADIKAVFKRCVFCAIDRSVVPQVVREAYDVERRRAWAGTAAGVLGGANAVP